MSHRSGTVLTMANGGGFSSSANSTYQAQQVVDALTLEGGSQFQIAIIALAAVNMASAIAMIGNILYDAWTVRHWDFETKRDKYFGWLLKIHPAEMFPLIISGSVVLQGLVFVTVQATNAMPILYDGCGRTVQLVFPALWIPFSTMLVFGLETTFRSLRRVRFPTRNRWHIPTAIMLVAAMIFFAWAATNVFPTRGKCLTGLVWWTARYAKLAVVLSSGLLTLYPASAVIITLQLVKTVKVEKAERIAATRVVYYLVVNIWLIALILPYYIQILDGTSAVWTAMIAEVSLNITGIINLILHIFLRANADRLAIRAVETPWSDKRTIRVFGPSDLNIRDHISYPVLWHEADRDHNPFITKSEKSSPLSAIASSDYDTWSASGPLQHVVFPSPTAKSRADLRANRPLTPPLTIEPVRRLTRNNSSYGLFPRSASGSVHALPKPTLDLEKINDRSDLPLPPAPLFAHKHDRSVSAQSSATVQIGLRLSYMNHALDPIEASPPSIIGFPAELHSAGLSDDSDDEEWANSVLARRSTSSETIENFEYLPAQSYKIGNGRPHEVLVAPRPIMPNSSELSPNSAKPEESAEPIPLSPQAFNAPRSAPTPPQARELVNSPPSSSIPAYPMPNQLGKPQLALHSHPVDKSLPRFSAQPNDRSNVALNTRLVEISHMVTKPKPVSPARPSGLPINPKPAPSWRPQNWNTPRNNSPVSPTIGPSEEKALPGQKALPTVSSATPASQTAFMSNNPFKAVTPPVISRPPGWK